MSCLQINKTTQRVFFSRKRQQNIPFFCVTCSSEERKEMSGKHYEILSGKQYREEVGKRIKQGLPTKGIDAEFMVTMRKPEQRLCRNVEMCNNFTSKGLFCQPCFAHEAHVCRVCSVAKTTFSNGLCKTCFHAKNFQCRKCQTPVKSEGYCQKCYKPWQECHHCSEKTRSESGVCKSCQEKNLYDCRRCSGHTSLPDMLCDDCLSQPCQSCHKENTKNKSGICATCYENSNFRCNECQDDISRPGLCTKCFFTKQGKVKCRTEDCNRYIAKNKDDEDLIGVCSVCYKSQGKKCASCGIANVVHGRFTLCRMCHLYNREVEHASSQCLYSYKEHGVEFRCQLNTTYGKYCYDCFCLMNRTR